MEANSQTKIISFSKYLFLSLALKGAYSDKLRCRQLNYIRQTPPVEEQNKSRLQ